MLARKITDWELEGRVRIVDRASKSVRRLVWELATIPVMACTNDQLQRLVIGQVWRQLNEEA